MTPTATTRPQPPQAAATPARVDTPASGVMPFAQHLAELRRRLMICLGTVVLATTMVFMVANQLIAFLQRLAPAGTLFVQLTPGEVFLASFKLCVLAGVGLSLPVLVYQALRFLMPGLNAQERRLVIPVMLLGLGLFIAGVAFGYAVVLPLMLDFLLGFGQQVAQNQLSIAAFLDFCMGFLFASGLVFQMPLLLLVMGLLGWVRSAQLAAQWKWAVVACFLLGAIITPSADPFSQVVMAGSLFGLYAFSLGLLKAFGK